MSSSVWRLPASLPLDLGAMEQQVAKFKQGEISSTQFQVFRVPQGVYEQREAGTYMLRVRLPGGVALPHQLRCFAEVAERFGNGVLHVTTRQDIQVHRVSLEGIHPALTALAAAGLSTKGGGGNTVRNLTACPHAGVCAREIFDVTPQVLALTESLLADPQSFQLPRKYKIAFSGCGEDCAGATVHDVGFVAKTRDGQEGFAVYVGGGLGSSSRVSERLEEFIPVAAAPMVAEAVKRVFNAHGNRKDKRQARLRFLVRQLGFESFRRLYREELERLADSSPATPRPAPLFSSPPPQSVGNESAESSGSEAYRRWRSTNVQPQRQPGLHLVEIPLFLGDIPAASLRALADIVERYGERSIRATQKQNLVLRGVSTGQLASLHEALSGLGLAQAHAPILRDMIACTGASTCKLGICLSRGMAEAVADRLSTSGLDLESLGRLQLNISGCPNACGRHPVADIGLHGAARRVDGRPVPHYVLQLGGHVEEGRTTLAEGRHSVPAHQVPALVNELLSDFATSENRPDFRAFLRHAGESYLERLTARYRSVPDFNDDASFYVDWGAKEPFSLAGRGPGECGAGVFDLIEVDLKGAAEALEEGSLYRAAALASRALLVTRGEQANSDAQAFELFRRHFLEPGLVDGKHRSLIDAGLSFANQAAGRGHFPAQEPDVRAFVLEVQQLFRGMDATLQFVRPTAAQAPSASAATPETSEPTPEVLRDLREITCPHDYVRTKLEVERLRPGQVLVVLLNESSAMNVPESIARDGHEVLSVSREGTDSRVRIRKGTRP